MRFKEGQGDVVTVPDSDRPLLSERAKEARASKDYRNIVPVIIQVPTAPTDINSLFTAVAKREQADLLKCVAEAGEGISKEGQTECANLAKGYDNAKKAFRGVKNASGGGFDFTQKGIALRTQLDAAPRNKKHLIIATMNPLPKVDYYIPQIENALKSKNQRFSREPFASFDIKSVRSACQRGNFDEIFASLDQKRRYINVAAGDVKELQQCAINLFKHKKNVFGQYFEALIINGKSFAGTDVPGAHYTHILSPPRDLKSQQQAYGRILRQCSLNEYAAAEGGSRDPTVYIFTYVSTVDPKQERIKVTPDELVMRWLDTQRGSKSAVDLMYEEMRKAAVDRYFFYDYSTGKGAEDGETAKKEETRIRVPMDATDYLLWSLAKANEGLILQTGGKEEEEKRGKRYNIEGVYDFANKFYQVRPWDSLVPSANTLMEPGNVDYAFIEPIYKAVRKLALSSGRIPDFPLLTSYIATLDNEVLNMLIRYLQEKKNVTPQGIIDGFEKRTALVRNAEFERIELNREWLGRNKAFRCASAEIKEKANKV